MAEYTTGINVPKIISVNEAINNNSNGYWKIVGNTLVHDNALGSYTTKLYPFLTIGKQYKLTYIASNVTCSYRAYFGEQVGNIQTTANTVIQIFTFTGTDKNIKFWSNGNVTITSIKIEELQKVVTDTAIPLDDPELIENKSFTLSYYPIGKQYVSYHSYLPNNYIIHPNSLIAKRNDSQLMQVNKGNYGKYFDSSIKSFIIETIFNEYPTETKVFDNLTVNLKSSLNDISTNKFFDSVILNTEYQCSGEITLNLANLTKKERNWAINKFTDITNNSANPLFTSTWNTVSTVYPIDKVVNNNKIDYSKPWYKRGRLRDKFLEVRFIENNLENQKIILNFVSTIYRASQR